MEMIEIAQNFIAFIYSFRNYDIYEMNLHPTKRKENQNKIDYSTEIA